MDKIPILKDIGDFGFPLLMLLALSPMSFKKGPNLGMLEIRSARSKILGAQTHSLARTSARSQHYAEDRKQQAI